MTTEAPASPENAERGIPSLDARSSKNTGTTAMIKILMIAGVLVLMGGIAASIGLKKFKEHRQSSAIESAKTQDSATKLPPLGPPPADKDPPLPDSMAAPGATHGAAVVSGPGAATAATPMTPQQQQAQSQQAALAAQKAEQARQKIAESNLLAFGAQTSGAGRAELGSAVADPTSSLASALQAQAALNQQGQKPAASGATLDGSLKGVAPVGTGAQMLADRSLTITQGTMIPCALITAINSTVPGFTKCQISEDVYSADGRVLLAERGSVVVGQYESSSLKQGMSRIFMLWTRLETVNGVVINLDSPATDELGRSGVDGNINNHFWQRFGAGLLLSIVDDVSASAANRNSGGGQQQQYSNTQNEGQQAASIALQHSVDIPPTLTKDQGGIVKIFVARDLFFGNVYGFRTANR